MATVPNAVEMRGIVKRFGHVTALGGADFAINAGAGSFSFTFPSSHYSSSCRYGLAAVSSELSS